MNKPETIVRPAIVATPKPSTPKPEKKRKIGERILGFLIRGAVAAVIAAAVFLPYKGSETVSNAAKIIVMSDITGAQDVGEGKIVDIFREFFGGNDDSAQ